MVQWYLQQLVPTVSSWLHSTDNIRVPRRSEADIRKQHHGFRLGVALALEPTVQEGPGARLRAALAPEPTVQKGQGARGQAGSCSGPRAHGAEGARTD